MHDARRRNDPEGSVRLLALGDVEAVGAGDQFHLPGLGEDVEVLLLQGDMGGQGAGFLEFLGRNGQGFGRQAAGVQMFAGGEGVEIEGEKQCCDGGDGFHDEVQFGLSSVSWVGVSEPLPRSRELVGG